MQFRSFRFHTTRLHSLFAAPRKPRSPLVRLALGLVGVVLLACLVVVGLFVGTAMVAGGLAWRLLRRGGGSPVRNGAQVVDAEYRVLRKPVLPASR